MHRVTNSISRSAICLPAFRSTLGREVQTIYQRKIETQAPVLTHSYAQGVASASLLGETIPQRLSKVAEKYPDKEFLVFQEEGYRVTFSEFRENAGKIATGLLALGLQKGDRIGIWGTNCLEWVLVQYATAMAGMIMVNINPAYRSHELQYALGKVGCKALIMMPKYKASNYYDILREIIPELKSSETDSLKSVRLPSLKHVILTEGSKKSGTFMLQEVSSLGGASEMEKLSQMQLCFDEPINIQFTSGTTGSPKGATLTHHNIMNNAYFLSQNLGYFKPDTKICIPVPLYHCFGMVLGSLAALISGSVAVFPSRAFNAELSLKAVHTERCTSIYGTPTMFIDMLNVPSFQKYDLKSLRTGVMAGSQCPEEVMKEVIHKMHCKEISIVYGQTEASPITNITHHKDPFHKRIATVGRPFPFVEVKIVDENRKIVPINTTGEVCFRGHGIMRGYWGDEGKTKDTLDDSGWLYSGDLGCMDEHGYFKIVGRSKDMIVRGGENIYPMEIEEFLHKHPKIKDVQVIGVRDERLGEEVCAWLRLHDGKNMSADEVKAFCKDKISYFKIPKHIKFVNEFPLTVTGKVKKYEMREMMARELNSEIVR